MTDTTLQLWGVIGTWLASIGTLSAVAVSLWLAYDKDRIKLKIRTSIIKTSLIPTGKEPVKLIDYTGSNTSEMEKEIKKAKEELEGEFCQIKVVNIGNKSVIINNIGWTTGQGTYEMMLPFDSPRSDEIPKILNQGEEANFIKMLHQNAGDNDWIIAFPKMLVGDTGKEKYIKQLKVIVSTSVGQLFAVKVEDALINKLLESYRTHRKQEQKP